MNIADRTDRYCVIGAGASGLTVAKNLQQQSISCDVIDREDDVGGNWYYGRPHSSVCRSTHLISSKRQTEMVDFPMPDHYPDYPNHRLVWQYLRDYAQHFNLYPLIEFHRSVQRVEPDGHTWLVTLDRDETRRYAGVVIANGHNWDPKYPDYPGHFDGLTLHATDYKTPDILYDRRVLIVGAGNSGCDIAVEAAQNAARTFHSVRRGYHYMPKYFLGVPSDVLGENMLRWRVPLPIRRFVASALAKMILGWPQDYGLRKPDHKLFETHPIVNSQMLYYVGHGDITPKPDVAELCGQHVRFVDGTQEPIDVLIYATGYNITFPFIDLQHLDWTDGRPDLYLHVFHRRYDNLFVAGLLQPDSGQFGLVDYQAQAIAHFITACRQSTPAADRFRRTKATAHPDLSAGISYLKATRHLLEVEHFSYRQHLRRAISQLAPRPTAPISYN